MDRKTLLAKSRERSKRYYRKNRTLILAKRRKYRRANASKLRAYRQRYYKRRRSRWKYANLRVRYGLTQAEYERLLLEAGDRCPVCLRETKRWAVDHDHRTGVVRGLICGACNSGMGLLGDSISRLEGAIRYLKAAQTRDKDGSRDNPKRNVIGRIPRPARQPS